MIECDSQMFSDFLLMRFTDDPNILLKYYKINKDPTHIEFTDIGQGMSPPSTINSYLTVFDSTVDVLQMIPKFAEINPVGKWAIILTETNQRELIENLFCESWKSYKMLNLIVLFPEEESEEITIVSFYHPFVMTVESESDSGENGSRRGEVYYYPLVNWTEAFQIFNRRLNNMHNYPVDVFMFEVENCAEAVYDDSNHTLIKRYKYVDGEVLYILSESMKFSVNYIKTNNDVFGVSLPNGSSTGGIELIDNYKADFHSNIRTMGHFKTQNTLFLYAIEFVDMFFILPKANPEPQRINIFVIELFDMTGRYILVIVLIITTLIWYTLDRLWRITSPDPHYQPKNLTEIILIIYSTQYVCSVKDTKILHNRIILVTLFLIAMVISNSYQGTIVRQLSTLPAGRDFQTVEEVADSPLHVIIYASSTNMFDPTPNSTIDKNSARYKIYMKNTVNNTMAKYHMTKMAADRNFTMLMRRNFVNYFKANFFNNETGRDLFHIVPDSPVTYHSSFIVPKKSPYTVKFNEGLLRSVEFGFVLFGWQQAKQSNDLNYIRRTKLGIIEGNREIKIKLEHLEMLFVLWGIMLLIAGITFLLEITYKRYGRTIVNCFVKMLNKPL